MSKSRLISLVRHAAFAALIGLTAGTLAVVVQAQSAARLFATLSANLASGVSTPVTCTQSGSGCFLDVSVAGGSMSAIDTITFSGGSVLAGTVANTLDVRNGVNAQRFNLYKTYTDVNNYEVFTMGVSGGAWDMLSTFAGTGAARNVSLRAQGANLTLQTGWNIPTSNHILAATDNSYDIGASGATRPRTGYFGTSTVSPLYSSSASSVLSISANVLTPTSTFAHVGAGLIKTITVPAACTPTCAIYLVPDAAYTYDATGNVVVPAAGGTATINRLMIFMWDGTKWTPSY